MGVLMDCNANTVMAGKNCNSILMSTRLGIVLGNALKLDVLTFILNKKRGTHLQAK
jgi:hypothetical protein